MLAFARGGGGGGGIEGAPLTCGGGLRCAVGAGIVPAIFGLDCGEPESEGPAVAVVARGKEGEEGAAGAPVRRAMLSCSDGMPFAPEPAPLRAAKL